MAISQIILIFDKRFHNHINPMAYKINYWMVANDLYVLKRVRIEYLLFNFNILI